MGFGARKMMVGMLLGAVLAVSNPAATAQTMPAPMAYTVTETPLGPVVGRVI